MVSPDLLFLLFQVPCRIPIRNVKNEGRSRRVDVVVRKACEIGELGRAVKANLKHVLVGFEKEYSRGAEYYPCQRPERNRSRHVERIEPTVEGANKRMSEGNESDTSKIEFEVQVLLHQPPYLGTV
jgi:hypothetical protein